MHPIALLWNRSWLTRLLIGVSFRLFGMTVNIFVLFKANIDRYVSDGTMVIADGALLQLAELIGYGHLSLSFYLVFKACEHVLVKRLTGERQARPAALRGTTDSSPHSRSRSSPRSGT